MSAFFCNAYHVAALAQAIGRETGGYPEAIADTLARANMESIAARYGDGPADWFDIYDADEDYPRDCVATAKAENFRYLSQSDVEVMAHCFDYQACEYKGWEKSTARDLLSCVCDLSGEMPKDALVRWEFHPDDYPTQKGRPVAMFNKLVEG